MTDQSPYNVLFLCTGNSARSIIAESILNRLSAGRFTAYSAGSHPSGQVHPIAADMLTKLNYNLDCARSKSWDEFATEGAPPMDLIFTVCDNAPDESCPIWPGRQTTAYWPFPDPAIFNGAESDHRALFTEIYRMIERGIAAFIKLPIDTLDEHTLGKRMDELKQEAPASVR